MEDIRNPLLLVSLYRRERRKRNPQIPHSLPMVRQHPTTQPPPVFGSHALATSDVARRRSPSIRLPVAIQRRFSRLPIDVRHCFFGPLPTAVRLHQFTGGIEIACEAPSTPPLLVSLYPAEPPPLCVTFASKPYPIELLLFCLCIEDPTLSTLSPGGRNYGSAIPISPLVDNMTHAKSFMTMKLGEGARVQFPQAILNTGYAGETIQFETIFEVMQFEQFLPENLVSMPTAKGVAKKPTSKDINEKAPKRASIFSRLSMTPTAAPVIQKKFSDPKL
ncbi:hypothetical protein MA16_Dca002123 [Dendrobium catenatum]|uniref:Uncharacterized protein n=1 Tax=Dendrobium catenatum TaxID=906689 RepID=A0A2I0XEF7_9ASPA|nr:hypothetical protein MA16_Dca002123 [Dendrobium catenatum]